MVRECGLTELAIVLDVPSVPLLVVNKLGCIVTLVQVLEDSRQHLRTFIRKVKAASTFEELCLEC